jgi:hypothetical protein
MKIAVASRKPGVDRVGEKSVTAFPIKKQRKNNAIQ